VGHAVIRVALVTGATSSATPATVDSRRGRIALMVAHCAGMIDLVALPVWVCAVLASVLHALCGLGTGAALSITHGTIARSGRPHRVFAAVNMAPGVFAVLFLGIVGIACVTVLKAMTFSFLERVGSEHGFERQAINGVLIALGLVNVFPAGFAALLIFVHTFAFGLIAKLESTSRAPAATPAMVMTGSAIWPILGGTLVKGFGYGSLGVAAAIFAAVAVFYFSCLPSAASTASSLESIA
jgi:hypothetical protein